MKLKLFAQASALLILTACDGGAPRQARAPLPTVPAQPALPAARDPMSLAERLAFEAKQHPDAVQLVEEALAGFEQEGVGLARKHQVLARVLDAQYCQSSVSAGGIGVALCVFADAGSAERGLMQSRARFDRLIPGRTLIAHERVLLTLTPAASDSARREIEAIQRRFLHASMSKHAAL